MRLRRTMLAAAGLALAGAPVAVLVAQEAAPRDAAREAAARAAALDAAAGWRDALEAHRVPQLPPPGDEESAILLLAGEPAAAAPPAARAEAARRLADEQDALAEALEDLGATVTFRYRVLLNALAVRVPAGRMEAVAALPEVAAISPVTFMAPAQAAADPGAPHATDAAPRPSPPLPPRARPARIALVDGPLDPSHPWLGGGTGPTFPVLGGADLVDRDGDPTAAGPAAGHATAMAGLVLRSPALSGLEPRRAPRLLAYRVVAEEAVEGRVRPLARTDRVLAALERAVDPGGDGSTSQRAEVILLGLSAGFDGAGADPVRAALASADRVGSTVVVPAGNDGPTLARPGSVGGPAAAPTAISVGGVTDGRAPRTADLLVRLGPATARLGPLPLSGPAPPGGTLPVAIVIGPGGLATGEEAVHYAGPDGRSRVEGAIAVVARGGGSLAETAAAAREAGAVALAVWDEAGPAAFPAVEGPAGLTLPVIGLGRAQGAALAALAADRGELTAGLEPRERGPAEVSVAAFSSSGPTAAGRQKPDLVAPAVARVAPWPAERPSGGHGTAAVTGTSAAAAEVAARALRLRVDRPGLGPRAVHSLLVQAARPLPGVPAARQGAGLVAPAGDPALLVRPAIVVAGPGAPARVRLGDLSGAPGRYALEIRVADGRRVPVARDVRVAPGGGAVREVRPPERLTGRLVATDLATGEVAGSAPLFPPRPAATPDEALGAPEVRTTSGSAEVLVRIGALRREGERVLSARLHGVRLDLVPREGDPVPVAGRKHAAAWPAGTYRFVIARRLATGGEVPGGAYRLRVTATGPDGTMLRRLSPPFTLE